MGGSSISEFETISLADASELCKCEMEAEHKSKYLRGIVDMGSNGIRFSVSDLSPPTARILATVYMYRTDISLYDAQYDRDSGQRIPIPDTVIDSVIAALIRFQIVCKDFFVPDDQIRILATEATRTALNGTEFLKSIKKRTGLTVELLAKEDEGRIGALGIASGFSDIQGLAIDMGGGSCQLTWLISQNGNVRLSPQGSFSFPYGAAALTKKLRELRKDKSDEEADEAIEAFRKEMTSNFISAYSKLEVPSDLVERAKTNGGFSLFLSGGGFRGWGYLLLYLNQKHGHHYPISIINGYSAPKEQFANVDAMKEAARAAHKIFRVSDRRREQVPAVAFLVSVIANSLPHGIKEANFCQGGVREGVLFKELLPSIRDQDPLSVATSQFASSSIDGIHSLILASIPSSTTQNDSRIPESIITVCKAFAQVLYVHAGMSKESSSTAALYSTSTGLMASTHGISHQYRALLALMLEERYEGELPPREIGFKTSLRNILSPAEVWWTRYLGKVGFLVGRLYPAGKIDEKKPRVVLSSEWSDHMGKHRDKRGVKVVWSVQKRDNDPAMLKETLEEHIKILRKVGKRKNWIVRPGEGEETAWGLKVDVSVVEEDIM